MFDTRLHSSAGSHPAAPPLSRLQIRECSDKSLWDDFVLSSPRGTPCHLFGWKAAIEQAYRQRTYYVAAYDGTELRGVLPLVLTKSPFFGVHLTSMPYMDCGGILTEDQGVRQALLQRAREIRAEEKAALNLRYLHEPQLGLPVSLRRVTMLLELGDSVEELWSRLPSRRRNRIRKGQKNNLAASWHREDGLEDFYNVFARNMRDLGSPAHGLPFFRNVLQQLHERAAIVLVRDGGVTIGAAFCIFFGDTLSIPWASSLRSHFKRCPNQVLYWGIMQYGIANGYRFMDFGRSARGDGTYKNKLEWGTTPVQLHWVYEPHMDDPASTEIVKKYGTAVRCWRRLPVSLTKVVGPWIRKGLSA